MSYKNTNERYFTLMDNITELHLLQINKSINSEVIKLALCHEKY